MTKELEEVKGRVLALSLTLSSVISALPRARAVHAAVGLRIHREALLLQDARGETSAEEISSRDFALDEYVKKLLAVVK